MRIRPGEPWGGTAHVPADAPIVDSDAALAALVDSCGDDPDLVVGLAGGDLCRSLGGRGDIAARLGGSSTVVPVDVGLASFSGGNHRFVAHLVARRRLLPGVGAVVMNADRLGPWVLAPRGHPGDGLFDVTRGSLGPRQFLMARSRARTGDHLPHPSLITMRAATVELVFDHPVVVRLDGVVRGGAREISVSMEPRQIRVAV